MLIAANSKLRVYTEPPPTLLEYPCLVVEPIIESLDYDLAFGGNSWSFVVPLTLSIRKGQPTEAWKELMKYVSPTGTESIKAGIRTGTRLNNTVDDSIIEGARNIGRDPSEDQRGQVYGAQFLLRIYETIA